MQSYLIAKYVDDIRRNEPVNVGVVVLDGSGRARARFEGEDDAGRLDKRRIRKRIGGRDAYVAWVQHWRRLLESGQPDLTSTGSADFYIETGGTVLLDLDNRSLEDAVRDLYARLVKPEDPPAPVSLQERSLRALRLAGADLDDRESFQQDIRVDFEVGGRPFVESLSYGVRNGGWHYLQEVSFDPQRPRRSRKEANHCAFLMEHAVGDGSGVVLFDGADIDETTQPMLDLVCAFAEVIDVGQSEEAVASLQQKLSLGAS